MATWSNRSIIRFIFHFITLFTSFSLTISSQPSAEVKSLIYSLQNKYCGRQFCTSDPSQEPPSCTEEVITMISVDPATNQTFHFDVPTPKQIRPPCSKCSCSDSCSLYGDCCADKQIGREYYFDCQEINQHVPFGDRKAFSLAVVKCLPDAPNYSEDLAEKCEHGELGYIPDGRLVTAPHPQHNTSVTFRNKYCAMCYNIKNYTPWNVYISCHKDLESSNHTDINSLIRSVSESNDCTVSTDHKEFRQSAMCDNYPGMISTCNVTGQWQEYNETVEAACHYYLNPIPKYRNIFCALCNGKSKEDLMCPNGIFIIGHSWTRMMLFSAIVSFVNSDVEVIKGSSSYPVRRIGKQEEHQCREGDVFDAISEKCREVYCPLMIHRENTTCAKVVSTEAYVETSWMLWAYYTDDIIIPSHGSVSPNVGGSVINALQGHLADWGFTLSSSSPSDFASIHSIHSLIIKESQIEVGLLLLPESKLESSRQQLVDTKNFTLNITWLGETKGVHVVPNKNPIEITDMLMLPGRGPPVINGIAMSKTINVPLTFNVSCPMVRFESHEVLIINRSVIIHGDTVLEEDHYFVKDKTDYFICFDAVFESAGFRMDINEPTKVSDEFRIEQIVTLVCFACSLIFLMLTMLVYILIRQFHTVPGFNLILLTFSLFVAQALYFFGAEARSVTTVTICTVIGVLIHYFWLVVFAWMSICSVNLVRNVIGMFNSLHYADDKKFVLLKYSAFAFGAPLLIVGITIFTSYIISGYTSIGYGGSPLCFAPSGFTFILSFGVPALVTVLINTIVLIYSTVKIRRAENGSGGKEKSGTNDIVKFFELSTITGLSWLFGFLGYFFQRVELLYVFTGLTAVQGVFIFFTFVISRPIFKLLKEKKCCFRGSDMKQYPDDTFSRDGTFSETTSPNHI